MEPWAEKGMVEGLMAVAEKGMDEKAMVTTAA